MFRTIAASAAACAFALAACSSNDKSPTQPIPPGPPSSVTAAATSANTVTVTYTAVSGATSYVIQRSSGGSAYAQVGTSTTTSFTDAGLQPGTQYSYEVASVISGTTTAFSTPSAVTTKAAGAVTTTLTGNITADRTLYADTLYVLSGYVKVRPGATLFIQPGTKLVGDTTVAGSSLWITRGAKIDAEGTAGAPIVFTSQRAPGSRLPGDWGGVIIVGNALVNRSAGGGVATMFTEGPQGSGQNTGENYGGGTDANDNSGKLRYVRIEFAGYAVLPDQELNSLSSYAVGRGTTYDYVESLSGLDDSFEFFGGSVDIRHMVSYESGDDHFDYTEGFNGRGQFLIALQTFQPTPRSGAGFPSVDPRGFEADGCEIDKAGCTSYLVAPLSEPVFANFTVIGAGPNAFTSVRDGNGSVFRRGAGGTLVNGIIARWQGVGLNVRDAATDQQRTNDSLTISNVILNENFGNTQTAGTNYDAAGSVCNATTTTSGGACGTKANFPNTIDLNLGTSTLFTALPAPGTVPTVAALDWTPASGSALTSGGMATLTGKAAARTANYFGGSMPGTTYIGAAEPGGVKWWAGWTAYARN